MNWIGRERKTKEAAPQKKVRRGTAALAVVAAMALAVLLWPAKKTQEEDAAPTIETWMDEAVDSLITKMGYPEHEIYYRGDVETLTQQLECPEEDEIVRLELRRDLIEKTPGLSDAEKIRQIEEIQLTIEQLETQVEAFYSRARTSQEYYSRRIRFSTPDGRKYTFFEQMMGGHYRTRYFKDITGDGEDPKKGLQSLDLDKLEEQ